LKITFISVRQRWYRSKDIAMEFFWCIALFNHRYHNDWLWKYCTKN